MAYRIEIGFKKEEYDSEGASLKKEIKTFLNIDVEKIFTRKVFNIDMDISKKEAGIVKEEFRDTVIEEAELGFLDISKFDWLIMVGFKPGVTDNVGKSSRTAIEDITGRQFKFEENVYTEKEYILFGKKVKKKDAERIGKELLANELIHNLKVLDYNSWKQEKGKISIPKITTEKSVQVKEYDLNVSDDELMEISRKGILSLSLEEMFVIGDYYDMDSTKSDREKWGLSPNPTDVELECLAQTWSEHCKHKIFNARITYVEEGRVQVINSLFKSYIQRSTAEIGENIDWLVRVFDDNAGVIKFNDRINLIYKVETHNTPSALDPYGGAITGIVGVNRDPMGTGKGAELLINTWGYCFASPYYKGEIPKGLMHPARIRNGVHQGVIDGGNQSGIPYGRGFEIFDDRYLGKPLVFCGTVGKMPVKILGELSHLKSAKPGDLIVMTGGRIGKDGIHGATFSSAELTEESPSQAVQIGDPITQKKMYDFIMEARDIGLYNSITDNGAGGLSSSIGEMCLQSGGAELDLSKAPVKYQGLDPWEILLSEAQERMSLAVPEKHIEEFKKLAEKRDVEVSELGVFTNTGYFKINYGDKIVGLLDLDFLHNGLPVMDLKAVWAPEKRKEMEIHGQIDYNKVIQDMIGRLNIVSNEKKCRHYDHEVKGLSVIKPFIGKNNDVPSDASIFLAEYGSYEGIVLGEGINPFYSDIDTYHMAASVIDEAVRRVVAVGGDPDRIAGLDNFCWPDPVQSEKTPDGYEKLAQLVRANKALYEYTKAFNVPCISGKDSMKNDSILEGRKISIPPTLLFSALGKINDIRKAVTMDLKKAGDIIYLVGNTYNECGGSEFYRYMAESEGIDIYPGTNVPKVDPEGAKQIYSALYEAVNMEMVHSVHTPVKGGLGAALVKTAMAGELGLEVDLREINLNDCFYDYQLLFSESNSRFIVTVSGNHAEAFEKLFKNLPLYAIGRVLDNNEIIIKGVSGEKIVHADLFELKRIWKEKLNAI
ncbi:AIR synthase-related protein [candidate division KSB1 bacterium]